MIGADTDMTHSNARQLEDYGFGQGANPIVARQQFKTSLALAGLFGLLALAIAFVASREALRLPMPPIAAQGAAAYVGALSADR